MLDAMAAVGVPSLAARTAAARPRASYPPCKRGRCLAVAWCAHSRRDRPYRANEVLAEKSRILDAVLQSMDQGMAMPDATAICR